MERRTRKKSREDLGHYIPSPQLNSRYRRKRPPADQARGPGGPRRRLRDAGTRPERDCHGHLGHRASTKRADGDPIWTGVGGWGGCATRARVMATGSWRGCLWLSRRLYPLDRGMEMGGGRCSASAPSPLLFTSHRLHLPCACGYISHSPAEFCGVGKPSRNCGPGRDRTGQVQISLVV
jgi:hypothetical protein